MKIAKGFWFGFKLGLAFMIGAPICLLGVLIMCTIVGILPGLFVFHLGGWPLARVIGTKIKQSHKEEVEQKREKALHHEPGVPPWLQEDFDIDDYPYGLN